MINTSADYQTSINDNRSFLVDLSITFADGSSITSIDGSLLMSGGLRFDDAVSAPGKLEIGAAIINQCTFILNNGDERFSGYEFMGAAVKVKVGLQLQNSVEWLNKGTFYIESAKTTGIAISITAIDAMSKFDRSYMDSKLEYPASLLEIYRDACYVCGVQMGSAHFTNDNYTVQERPSDDALTFREVISYVAQIACCFARVNNEGALELKWYDIKFIELEADLWGGNFMKEESGSLAFGGDFTDYNAGDERYGGDFTAQHSYHHFYQLLNQNIATDDIVVTGVRVSESQGAGENIVYSVGTEGYVVSIEKNALIQSGDGEVIANMLATELIGFKFRPLTVGIQYDPSIEAGDCAYVSDRKGNSYRAIISSASGGIGTSQTIRADAETPVENTSQRYTEAAKTYVEARLVAKQETANYNKLNDILTNGLGYYATYEEQADGSKVKYIHDKPNLAESAVIYKQTIDAYAVSTDGGQTWNFGYTKDGNIIAQTLSAIGINADWLMVGGYNDADGVITVKNAAGDTFIRIGKDGITMTNGAKLMGGNGVLSNMQVDSVNYKGATGFGFCGYAYDVGNGAAEKASLYLWVHIPTGFVVQEAYVTLYHAPFAYAATYPSSISGIGCARNLRLYKPDSINSYSWAGYYGSEYYIADNNSYLELEGAFGENGFTGDTEALITKVSANIGDNLGSGLNLLKIDTADDPPTTFKSAAEQCGVAKATINVIGYMS